MDEARIQELRTIALNGRSSRVSRTLKLVIAGDGIVGLVVGTGLSPANRWSSSPTPYIDVKCLDGETNGQKLVKDDWYRLHCNPAALRQFFMREEPAVGDVVAVEYRGKEQFSDGTSRHDIIAGVVRSHELGEDAVAVPAGSERPW